MVVRPIHRMKHLSHRLGRSKVNRIQYFPKASTRKQSRSLNIENILIHRLQNHTVGDLGCEVADILTGVSHTFTDGKKPLNIQFLYDILQCVELINSREVSLLLQVDTRQARKYVRAISYALPLIHKSMGD